MAVTCTSRVASGDDTNSKTYTVGSFAYQNNTLYTLAVVTSTTNQSPSGITGGGLTWVEVTNEPYNTIASPAARVSVWRGLVTSGATTGTLTITFTTTASRCCWCMDEWAGMDTSGTNGSGAIVQTAVNRANSGATSLTVTLSSGITAGNASYGAFGRNVRSAVTHGTDYTDLGTGQGASEANTCYTEYRSAGDTTPNCTFSSSAVGGVAIEIKAGTVSITATSAMTVTPAAVTDGSEGFTSTVAATIVALVAAVGAIANPVTATSDMTVVPAVVAAGAEGYTSTVAMTVTPAVVAAGAESLTSTAALTIIPTLAADGAESLSATAALTVTPSAVAAGAESFSATSALTITPAVVAAGAESFSATGDLLVVPAFEASGDVTGGAAGVTGSSALSVAIAVEASSLVLNYISATGTLLIIPVVESVGDTPIPQEVKRAISLQHWERGVLISHWGRNG